MPFICQQQPIQQLKSHPATPSSQLAINSPAPSVPASAPASSTAGSCNSNAVKSKQLIAHQKSTASIEKKMSSIDHGNGIIFSQKSLRKKSPLVIDQTKSEAELTIHVCDEVKGVSRDFSCPQKLLISKMGYFADITHGQKLEDMDISVHCDLEIFDWLIRWVSALN